MIQHDTVIAASLELKHSLLGKGGEAQGSRKYAKLTRLTGPVVSVSKQSLRSKESLVDG